MHQLSNTHMKERDLLFKLVFIFALLFLAASKEVFCQVSYEIKNAGIQISFPEKWSYGGSEIQDSIPTEYFDREVIPYKYRNYKKELSAVVAVSYENIEDTDIVTFSAMDRIKNPFEVKEVLTATDFELQINNGIVYLGTYADYIGIHTIYVVYLKCGTRGIRVFCDITDDLFEKLDPEFKMILGSIKEISNAP